MENGDNFDRNGNGHTRDLDDPAIDDQNQAVKERLEAILAAAQVTEYQRAEIIRSINQEAEAGKTRTEKHEIVVRAVKQLEFEFGQIPQNGEKETVVHERI